jgi:hypothetical protein
MRFFELNNFQDVMLYLFPTLVFLLVFGAGLAYSHFRTRTSREREEKVVEVYREGFSTRNAPFPLALTLIIWGTIIWAFFYILVIGIRGVKI